MDIRALTAVVPCRPRLAGRRLSLAWASLSICPNAELREKAATARRGCAKASALPWGGASARQRERARQHERAALSEALRRLEKVLSEEEEEEQLMFFDWTLLHAVRAVR